MKSDDIRSKFQELFGSKPALITVGPGRINLIGEHTDYNDGFVFPAAINRVTTLAISPTDGPSRLHSLQVGDAAPFDVNAVVPGQVTDWGKYPAGMGWALREAGNKIPNVVGVVTSTIPMGSGVSSSAALEMAFAVAWNQLAGLGIPNSELAKLGKVCENKFVGVNSGIMDQMASAMGKDSRAMFLDTRDLSIEYAPLPSGVAIVLCDTKKERALTDSAYNERRGQCEEAAKILGVPMLRDATEAHLASARSKMSDVVYRRAKHVVTENARCVAFREALDAGDLKAAGLLMRQSHESLRDDYQVSCDELDAMAEAAWSAPGCIGARMTGAGFGGACVALVKEDKLIEFTNAILSGYKVKTGRVGEALACGVVEGARVLEVCTP